MKRRTIAVGTFEVNCSMLEIGGRVYIVDPGAEAPRIVEAVTATGLGPAAVLLTHAHFDHIGAIAELELRYPGLAVLVGGADIAAFGHPLNSCPPFYPPAPRPGNLVTELVVPGMEVIATPGHTPGGVCYHFAAEKLLLSGDTLFAGSIGRTDLPGGDAAVLMRSLERLKKLPADTRVVPGHGPETTIGEELRSNPFMQ